MRILAFAVRSLVRQRARAVLGVLGVASVGALLFDMLLLSRGLVVSLHELLSSAGFDVRVLATDVPFAGPKITRAAAAVSAIAALPDVEEVVPIHFGRATAAGRDGRPVELFFTGMGPGRRQPWTVLEGDDLSSAPESAPPELIVNRHLARALQLRPGGEVALRGACAQDATALPPVHFRVAGIVEFTFEDVAALNAAARLSEFQRACGLEGRDEADLLLVASREGHNPSATVRGIRALRPDLHAFSNEELVAHFQQVGFTYFRQISTVLSSVTLFFGFLLIAVLLTVSVNQRFAEIAALRALGFSRRRVVLDVLSQSVLLVGTGGALSLPLGLALSRWLDAILRGLPDIPARLHFFVFEPRALVLHVALLALTALLAALYPMRLVAQLPIAATLRSEAVT